MSFPSYVVVFMFFLPSICSHSPELGSFFLLEQSTFDKISSQESRESPLWLPPFLITNIVTLEARYPNGWTLIEQHRHELEQTVIVEEELEKER